VSYDDLPALRAHVTPEAIVSAVKREFGPGGSRAAASKDDLPTLATRDAGSANMRGLDEVDPALVAALLPEHVIIDLSTLHYGMKGQYPMDLIRVYRKPNWNGTVSFVDDSQCMLTTHH
jgi:hypothetical protein